MTSLGVAIKRKVLVARHIVLRVTVGHIKGPPTATKFRKLLTFIGFPYSVSYIHPHLENTCNNLNNLNGLLLGCGIS